MPDITFQQKQPKLCKNYYEYMKQWTEKPLKNKKTNSQKLKTYSAPTVGNKVCDIEEHHRAITNRESTVSHHRLIVWQWLLSDMLHYPPGCHRETIKLIQTWWINQWRYTNIYFKQFIICTKYVLDDQSGGDIPEKSPSTDQRTHCTINKRPRGLAVCQQHCKNSAINVSGNVYLYSKMHYYEKNVYPLYRSLAFILLCSVPIILFADFTHVLKHCT